MDLLLDVNVVVDICTGRQPFEEPARQAVALCEASLDFHSPRIG